MKSKMKSAIVALASMLAVCLLFPSVASASKRHAIVRLTP